MYPVKIKELDRPLRGRILVDGVVETLTVVGMVVVVVGWHTLLRAAWSSSRSLWSSWLKCSCHATGWLQSVAHSSELRGCSLRGAVLVWGEEDVIGGEMGMIGGEGSCCTYPVKIEEE
jgi:hypothetical protein